MILKKIIPSFILTCSGLYGMGTTFQSPTPFFPQPRFARKNLTSCEIVAYSSTAEYAFNKTGQKVGLLEFNGPQDLFKRFVDPTLPYNDKQTFGKAILPANYTSLNYGFKLIQNIGSNFFISGFTTLYNQTLKDVQIQPIGNNCRILTDSEIDAQPELKAYLNKLNKILKIDGNNCDISQSSVGPSFFTFGYTKSWQDFVVLDFIDFSIQTGIAIPEISLEQNNCKLSAFPFKRTINIGIPILASCSLGIYDWLNFGATGMVMPFISNDQIIPLNTTPTHNNVLIDQHGLCLVKHKPLVYVNAYLEAERLIPIVTCLLGFSYTKQFATCYQAHDQAKFPDNVINKSPTHRPWEILDMTFSAELDLASDDAKQLPRIKFIYVKPLWGRSIFKTKTLAGQLAIEFLYDF